MLDTIHSLTFHPSVLTEAPYSVFHTALDFVVAYCPWPAKGILEVLIGFMYETEDRMGLIGDDREVVGETSGFHFDNSLSLDEQEEHE